MADSSNKTEKPTPQRLRKAREEGQFLSSKDMVGSLQFVLFVVILAGYAPAWFGEAEETTVLIFRAAFKPDLGSRDMIQLGAEAAARLLYPLGVAAAALTGVALLAQFSTTRFGVSLKKLKPSLKRLNPLSNLKELPRRNVPAAIQALAMMVIFTTAIWFVVTGSLQKLFSIPMVSLTSALAVAGDAVADLFWKAAGVFLLFGLIDLGRQFRRRQKDLRMSKQEIKDEMKQNDGDPHVKARFQGLRREMLRNQMLKEVPTATAVIVNPTHYAVAVRYEHGGAAVPIVVAKGRNHFALRIKELARSRDIPVVENPPLAQALHKSVKVGQEIPPHLYRAVAEVLAYVYRVMKAAEAHRQPRTQEFSRIL